MKSESVADGASIRFRGKKQRFCELRWRFCEIPGGFMGFDEPPKPSNIAWTL